MRRRASRRCNQITPANVGKLQVALHLLDRRRPQGYEAPPLVVDNTMYIVTPLPNNRLRARPDQARRAGEMGLQAQARCGAQGRRLLRHRSIAARSIRTARSSSTRSTGRRSPSTPNSGKQVWRTQARRHPEGRDDHHGAAGRRRQSAGRQFGRRDGRPRLARRRSTQAAARSRGRPISTGPDKDVLIGPGYKPLLSRRTRARTSASRPGRPRCWKIGGGTVWGWISYDPAAQDSSITAPAIRARGTPTSGPATTSGRPACSRATSTPARRAGSTRATPHDLYDHDDINEIILADIPWRNGSACRRCSGPAATASSTSWTGAPARCSRPTPYGYVNGYKGVDLKTRPDHPGTRTRSRKPGRVAAQHLPGRAGREGLEPVGVQPDHRPRLHPAHQPVHGHGRPERRITSPARLTSAPT